MKIAIDAMGGDEGPIVTVKGAIDAASELDITVVLIGQSEEIYRELDKYEFNKDKVEVIDARSVITNEEEPAMAIRKKKDSSMVVGLNMLKDKSVEAFISAGSTGALLSGGLLLVKRIKGIERPALATVYPTRKGISLLLDVGANADSKARYLQQFAVMGTIYSRDILRVENPLVGLVNIGTEKEKGNLLTKESYELLENTSNINFYGNIEARDIPSGIVDVLVCDGFVGNIVLKLTEGLGITIFSSLKETLTSSFSSKIGAFFLKPSLMKFKKEMDYSEYGGAPLLGIKGVVIKAHGSSNDTAIKNAIRQASEFVENKVIEKIEENITLLGGCHE